MKKLHLLSNAHLDPVWQWEWPEGAAAAISTFRVAADLCEQYSQYVFCHNEAVLYKWVKEYEPALFERIRKLVKAGRWKIIGGWFLQPDCNMPSGEDMTRQILVGQTFFEKEFGVTPTVGVSFDAFGHTRGLVQILEKAGYTGYLYMRPDDRELPQVFEWKGFADTCVLAHRLCTGYNTPLGESAKVVEAYLSEKTGDVALRCWGVGDHGGGPSHKDVADLNELIKQYDGKVEILHSDPESYFAEAVPTGVCERSLWTAMPGCYVSYSGIKQKHRRLECMLTDAERACSSAAAQGLMEYPAEELSKAWYDLLFCEFHDVLPGTLVQQAGQEAIRMLDHGMEIADRIYVKAFYALSSGQPVAKTGEIPILVYNSLPYPVTDTFTCEFMLADQNWKNEFTFARLRGKEGILPTQVIKEDSTIPLDWRKKIAFRATLEPMSMNRFDAELYTVAEKPVFSHLFEGADFVLENGELSVRIGRKSGLVESMRVEGREVFAAPSGALSVYRDNFDPWRMEAGPVTEKLGEFRLMSPARSAVFAGVDAEELSPIRVIEEGEVYTVVEALMEYEDSCARILYTFPKTGKDFGMDITVYFMEKDRMLRCEFAPAMEKASLLGQTMFGANELSADGSEQNAQRWVLARDKGFAFGLINDGVYGCTWQNGRLCQDLLRSCGYTAHPLPGRITMPAERFVSRMDQGERRFRLWLYNGEADGAVAEIDRLAQIKNEPARALCLFPCGDGKLPICPLKADGARLDTVKKAEDGNGWILRLFNPAEEKAAFTVESVLYGRKLEGSLKSFEVATYRLTEEGFFPVNLLEKPLQ